MVATHAGVTVGPDGSSHQALEDISLMRVLPNVNVVVPCDGPQTADLITAAADTKGPFYIRLGRSKFKTIENKGEFKLGRAQVLRDGGDVTVFACGIMVEAALAAADNLLKKDITVRVVNLHTIKPLDRDLILKAARETKGIVACEEHTVIGGLASGIDEVVAENHPTKVLRIGVKNRFGQSGDPADLLKEYRLTASDIEQAVLSIAS